VALDRHDAGHASTVLEIVRSPWFIVVLCVLLWLLVAVVIGTIYWLRYRCFSTRSRSCSHLTRTALQMQLWQGNQARPSRPALHQDQRQFCVDGRGCPRGALARPPVLRRLGTGGAQQRCAASCRTALLPCTLARRPRLPAHRRHRLRRGRRPLRMHRALLPHCRLPPGASGPAPGRISIHSVALQVNPPSPTPYATTTLVMNAHRQRLLAQQQQHYAVGPGYPPQQQLAGAFFAAASSAPDPRRLRQPVLLDFIPPPPAQPPPPDPCDAVVGASVHS